MPIAKIALLLLIINFANGRQNTPNGKSLTCQENGGYCQVHWDCCSGKCMTYNYVCAALAAPPVFHPEKPTQSLCQRNWNSCQRDDDCCSAKCIPFYNICAAGDSYPFPYFNPNSLQQKPIIGQPAQLEIVTLPNESNSSSSTGPINDKEKATSLYEIMANKIAAKPRDCKEIGQECYVSEDCCSKRCLTYAHKCVT